MSLQRAVELHAAGRTTDALVLLFNTVADPARTVPAADEKQLLAALLEGVVLNSGNAVIHDVLVQLLHDPLIDAQQVTRAVLGLITATPQFAVVEEISTLPDDEIDTERLAGALHDLLALPLLRALLPRAIVSEPRTERVMAFARRALLSLLTGDVPNESWHWDAVHLVAQAAFAGEYAWVERDDEAEFVDAAAAHLTGWLAAGVEAADGTEAPAPLLLLYTMYRRLTVIPRWERLAGVPERAWEPFRPWMDATLETHVRQRLVERTLGDHVPSLVPDTHVAGETMHGHADTVVSARVRAMYEEHPYPRWSSLAVSRRTTVRSLIRELAGREGPDPSQRILIAGCGTGRQAAHTARSFPDARILALDLSRASLGYAVRMTHALGIANVDYMQGDLLDLGRLSEQFSLIFCSGVLHHMHDPRAGWATLVERLHQRGIMKIALYSTIARRAVTAARDLLDSETRAGSDADVRAVRERLLALPPQHPARAVIESTDFYSLSGCRDLVMHVQERTYSIPQLGLELEALGLRFLGFQLPVTVQQAFSREFPAAGAARSLDAWAAFEERHPLTFWGMYQFFVDRR